MRLLTLALSTSTDGEPSLDLKEFIGKIPPYAILSHRWGADHEEVSFKDIETSSPSVRAKKGYQKIMNCYRQAVSDGFEYLWVDTCCIDKSSSAELSEGINSMFEWYKKSAVCYAYLEDVGREEDPEGEGSTFRNSVWFTRGWTLQELLAPESVIFIAADWVEIGTKYSLAGVISEVTKIDVEALSGIDVDLMKFSVAKRMSWAALVSHPRTDLFGEQLL